MVAHLGQAVTFEIEADIGPDQDPTNNIIPGTDTPDQDLADDGVLNMPLNLPHCKAATFQYDVNVIFPGVDLWANVWFDWNRDGDYDDTLDCSGISAPEWAVQNQFLSGLPVGLNTITTPVFLPWHSASDPNEIWMRITLSEQFWNGGSGSGGSGPVAGYKYGETEDYYFDPDTSCSECPDLNCDGIVNFEDFAKMANLWLQSCP